MSWQISNIMINGGNGVGGGEGSMGMQQQQQQQQQGNIPNRPPGTEYTLQGEHRAPWADMSPWACARG